MSADAPELSRDVVEPPRSRREESPFRVGRIGRDANPIWMRELRQAARLGRTPVILAVLTVLMTLLMASIGGIMATTSSPAQTGVVLFQTYFSIAFFVVALVGPAVAANAVASEREGRTWEALLLTGLRPGPVARGKFLAAYTAIGLYIVMLAPVGAIPFLFGGVTATEVVVAFVFLFLIALLAVAFGLALSSKLASLRAAIVLTLLLAFPLAIAAYSAFGVGLSVGAHKLWPGVPEGPPIWLPTAYDRATFGVEYVVYLVALPVALVTLPAWFLYEITIANLCTPTDDRSTGIKRWFLVATPLLTILAGVPAGVMTGSDRLGGAILGMSALASYLAFCAFLFQGEPIGASRRVKAQWERLRASRFRRFLGPSLPGATVLQLALGVPALLALGGFAALLLGSMTPAVGATSVATTRMEQMVAFAGYAVAFYVFVVGAASYLRARTSTAMAARVLLFGVLFAVAVGPWVVAAIGGLIADAASRQDALAIGAPSPFYVIVMLDAIDDLSPNQTLITAGAVAAGSWALLGAFLAIASGRRCHGIVARHEAMLAEAERRLADEDEAARAAELAAAAPVEAPAPEGSAPAAEP
jgi:ABC-type transport system involved in multi-copper enzyme maturation permease subunit